MSDILESKGYIYVNTEGKIMSVTLYPLDITDLTEIVVTRRIAQAFNDGSMSMYDWTATIDDAGYTLTSSKNISRTVRTVYQHPSLVKVENFSFGNNIVITLKNKTIRIDNNTGNTATFYITRKDDPSILYKSITVNDTVTESLPTCEVDVYSFNINAARINYED